MTQTQVNPRGTFLKVADALKARIDADPQMTHLPPVDEVMSEYKVSRNLVLRAYRALHADGAAEPVPGRRWRVIRTGQTAQTRPLHERIADIITAESLGVGAAFPSSLTLAGRFGVCRPTVTRALDRLVADGVLASGGQGAVRTVRSLPRRTTPTG